MLGTSFAFLRDRTHMSDFLGDSMKLKRALILILTLASSVGWADRPPRYPDPGNGGGNSPRPEPRPEPPRESYPEPRPPRDSYPSPRPEPRPNPRPDPYPDYPEPRPPRDSYPEPHPEPYPEPRPDPRYPRPRPPAPYPDEQTRDLVIPIHRYVTDQRLLLKRMLNLRPYENYLVESVIVNLRNSTSARLDLEVTGVVDDRSYAPYRQAILYPRQFTDLSDPYVRLNLAVHGQVYISTITVRVYSSNYLAVY